MTNRDLIPGEPAPWFTARCTAGDTFHFHAAAGRFVVLSFFGSAGDPAAAAVLQDLAQYRDRFDDDFASFFGVSVDPQDEQLGRVQQSIPGLRFFWDFDRSVSRLYGAERPTDAGTYRKFSVVLDERLRILTIVDIHDEHPHDHLPELLKALELLPRLSPEQPATVQAPILVVPRLFEPQLCRLLMEFYDRHGGQDSGFMREVNGKTVEVSDPSFKRRRDQEITDDKLRDMAMFRIHDRLIPEIHKAFQFKATRIERHIVACYDSLSRGHFSAHRDNTTKGTAHRRFAVSLNLNTGEYQGGKLRFPEFGHQTYEAPAGGAVVFSCSLLHEATPVLAGRRYAYLPFLYDNEAASIREANLQYLQLNADAEAGAR